MDNPHASYRGKAMSRTDEAIDAIQAVASNFVVSYYCVDVFYFRSRNAAYAFSNFVLAFDTRHDCHHVGGSP